MFSLKNTSPEVNCKNLSTRDNEFYTYKEKMGKGKKKNFYSKKPKKNLKKSATERYKRLLFKRSAL